MTRHTCSVNRRLPGTAAVAGAAEDPVTGVNKWLPPPSLLHIRDTLTMNKLNSHTIKIDFQVVYTIYKKTQFSEIHNKINERIASMIKCAFVPKWTNGYPLDLVPREIYFQTPH